MRVLCCLLIFISSFAAFSKNEKQPAPFFEVQALNSPVSEKIARFLFKVSPEIKIDKVSYQVFGPRLFTNQIGKAKEVQLINTAQGPELNIPVDGWKAGSYRLFVILKDKTKKEFKFERKLSRTIRDYVPFAVTPKSEGVQEPDPIKNNATLLGIDTDKNGIRDDIQIWINQKYQNNLELLQAFYDYAYYFQSAIGNKDNKELSNLAAHSELKAQECIMHLLLQRGMTFQQYREAAAEIRAIALNTKTRIQANDQVNTNFHGESESSTTKEEACAF